MATLIDGKLISAKVKEEIASEVVSFREEYGRVPGLAVIIVGEDPASQVYVRNKEKACETVGFYSMKMALPAETTEEELLGKIDELNTDPAIDGILVQLPLLEFFHSTPRRHLLHHLLHLILLKLTHPLRYQAHILRKSHPIPYFCYTT